MESSCADSNEVRSYEQEVLQLRDTRNEHDLDEQHHNDAQALGVDVSDPRSFAPSCVSSSTVSSTARRSGSVDSRRSVSTGLTSNFSRNSKDFQASPISPSFPVGHSAIRPPRDPSAIPGPLAPPSLTALPPAPTSPVSPTTQARSAFRPLSPSFPNPLVFNKGFSVRRGFGRISRLKRASTSSRGSASDTDRSSQPSPLLSTSATKTCSVCHDSMPAPASAVPRLQSQKSSLEVNQSGRRTSFLRHRQSYDVATRPKTASLPENRLNGSLGDAIKPQFASLRGRTSMQVPDGPKTAGPTTTFNLDEAQRNLDHAMEFPDFRSIRSRQEHERDRFLEFHEARKRKLAETYRLRRDDLSKQHSQTREDACKTHPSELTSLEDRHVTEEMDLLESQSIELRNCEIALKHMQAYCRSTSDPTSPTTDREVTLQDRRNLERQYWLRNNLPRRHESAINVMREQQARQLKNRSLKQMTQVSDLQAEQEKEIQALDRELQRELKELDGLMSQRRERLVKRWTLAVEIWKHCREQDEKTTISLPIKAIPWPDSLESR